MIEKSVRLASTPRGDPQRAPNGAPKFSPRPLVSGCGGLLTLPLGTKQPGRGALSFPRQAQEASMRFSLFFIITFELLR